MPQGSHSGHNAVVPRGILARKGSCRPRAHAARMPPPGARLDLDVGEAYARDAFARLERDPRDADGLFVLAVVLAVSGRRAEAIQTLTILGKVAPYYPGLWRLKSRMYREVGDAKMAALCLDAAKRISG